MPEEKDEQWHQLAAEILKLIVALDRSRHIGWGGISAAQSNAMSAAQLWLAGPDRSGKAWEIFKVAQMQYRSAKKSRPYEIREKLEAFAEELALTNPDIARGVIAIAEEIPDYEC